MSNKVEIGMEAPDFTLQDFQGDEFHLKDCRGEKAVFLVFNRGFA